MLDLLQKYGVELSITDGAANAQALIKLREIYATDVARLKGDAEKQESVTGGWIKALGDTVEGREDIASRLKEFKSAVLTLMYEIVDVESDAVIPLVETMAELKTASMNERDYWIAKVKRENTATTPKDEDYEEKREEMEKLAELIRLSFQFVSSGIDLTDKKFREAFPLSPKVEKGQEVKGVFLPDLPRLPQKRNETSGAAGRNASDRFLQFVWNNERIPAGTLVSDIAHNYVSDLSKGFVIDGTDLRKAVKESGQEFLPGPDGWSVEFPTGTLSGYDTRPAKDRKPEQEDTNTDNEQE